MVEQDLHPGLLPKGFPGGSVVKNLLANAGAAGAEGSIPGLGRSPGVGSGSPLQYSCLEIFMDRRAWWATIHGVAKEWDTTEHPLSVSYPAPYGKAKNHTALAEFSQKTQK